MHLSCHSFFLFTRPNSNQHIIRPYPEPAEFRAHLHALFFSHLEERYYSLDVIWVLADAKNTKCVPCRMFQGFVAYCKNISIFLFLQNKVKDNVAAMVLNPRLWCLLSKTEYHVGRSRCSFAACYRALLHPRERFLRSSWRWIAQREQGGQVICWTFFLQGCPLLPRLETSYITDELEEVNYLVRKKKIGFCTVLEISEAPFCGAKRSGNCDWQSKGATPCSVGVVRRYTTFV